LYISIVVIIALIYGAYYSEGKKGKIEEIEESTDLQENKAQTKTQKKK
jgi:ABC-type arginine transport system permease subunit